MLEKTSIKYETALTPIKDTAVAMLLILYIVVILNQAFNNKYNVKKDVKLLSVYVSGIIIILVVEHLLTNVIHVAF